MSLSRIILVCTTLTIVTGCGFRPLYDQPAQTTQNLEGIAVPALSGEFGYTLTRELRILLPQSGGASRYQLKLDPDINQTGLAIEQDDSVTRYNIKANVAFSLVDNETGETLAQDVARTLTSYNAITSQYSTLIAEREALRRSAQVLSQEIYQKLYVTLRSE